MSDAAELFVCCEPSDQALRDELCSALAPLVQTGLVREILPEPLDAGWQARIASADVVVALVGPTAIAEGSSLRTVLTEARAMEADRKTLLVPVRARACNTDEGPLADRVVYPRDGSSLDSETFREYAFRDAVSGVLTGVALCHVTVGDMLLQGEREAAAAASFRHALSIAEQLSADFPDDIDHLGLLGLVRDRVGEAYLAMGDGPGALAAFESAKEVHERLVSTAVDVLPRRQALARCIESIGDVLRAMGEKPLALKAFEDCLSLRISLASEVGDTPSRRDVASTYVRIGHVRRALGENPEALVAFRRGMDLAEQIAREVAAPSSSALVTEADVGVFQAERALFHFRTASVLAEGDGAARDEARSLLLRALAIYRELEERGILPQSQSIWPPAVEAMLDSIDT